MDKCMNDQDYIKAGVELADGWYMTKHGKIGVPGHVWDFRPNAQMVIDALAAQLVRQARKTHTVNTTNSACYVFETVKLDHNLSTKKAIGMAKGNDDCMNTIKAIVDSKVLK